MNGRVYDPVLGRFLSADPNIDGADDSQGFNRYSYVGNNPLTFSDPSGYFKFKDFLVVAIAVVVTAVVTVVTAGGATALTASFWSTLTSAGFGSVVAGGAAGGFASGFAGSLLNGGNLGDAFKAGAIGGITGAASAAVSFGIGKFFDANVANEFLDFGGRALAHGTAQGLITEASGGEFRHGFYSAAASSAASPLIGQIEGNSGEAIVARTVAAAAIGGTASALGGGKFANGAVTGAFTHLFNAEIAMAMQAGGALVAGGGLAAEGATVAAVATATAPAAAAAVVGAGLMLAEQDAKDRIFLTYTMTNPKTGQIYIGRTSGRGTIKEILDRRYAGHPTLRAEGFLPPVVDRLAPTWAGYLAIRGREQQLIDHYGGPNTATVRNAIRGVSQKNPVGPVYHAAANLAFGELHQYTGVYGK